MIEEFKFIKFFRNWSYAFRAKIYAFSSFKLTESIKAGIITSSCLATSRTAMYLRRFDRQTRIMRDTVVQDAILTFGRENIRRALAEEEDTPKELMHMNAEDISSITNALRGLFL